MLQAGRRPALIVAILVATAALAACEPAEKKRLPSQPPAPKTTTPAASAPV